MTTRILRHEGSSMTHSLSTHDEPAAIPHAELATFGPVHLDGTGAEQSLAFWRDAVGLQLRGEDSGALILGTERETLLVLHPGATSPARRGHAGLYHLAVHLPDEPEFARVLARLIAHR